MKKWTLDKILLLLIALAVLSSATLIMQRINIESNHKQVEFFIDYYETKELAEQSDESLEWWLRKFKTLGVTHVVLEEESLGLLRQELKPLSVDVGRDILREWNWQQFAPSTLSDYHAEIGIDDYDVVVMTEDESLYTTIASGLTSRYEENQYTLLEDPEGFAVLIHGTVEDAVFSPQQQLEDFEGRNYLREQRVHSSQLNRLSLGFSEEKIDVIQQSGLEVMPRPHGYKDWSGEKYINALLDDMESYEMIPGTLFFSGRQLPGYEDDSIGILEAYMRENSINLGLVETSFQREHLDVEGIDELTAKMESDSVRIFNVWPFIQQRYQFYRYEGAEEIENTLYRAVTERNIRLIYFKPFMENNNVYITDAEEYEKMFQRFEDRIHRHGLSLGNASTFPDHQPASLWMLLMILGATAGGVLLIKKLLPLPELIWIGLFLMGLLSLSGLWLWQPTWGEKLLALAAAVVFPSLGMQLFCEESRKCFLGSKSLNFARSAITGLIMMAKVTLVSSIGAMIVAAALSDVRYLLEIDIFRGVKVGQLIPIAIFALQFMVYFGYKRREEDIASPGIRLYEIRHLMMENIKIIYIAVLGFVMIAGYVYLARTGHEGNLQPMEIEMIIRNVLEEKLLVRPRTKEFTVAFPALMLGGYIASLRIKSLLFLTGMAAVIGQTSIVNTFSHLRTPVYVSVIRTIYSLLASIPFFLIYLASLSLFVYIFCRWIQPLWSELDLKGQKS